MLRGRLRALFWLMVNVGCKDLVNFYSSCRRFVFPYPWTLDVLANVKGFARHVTVPRLAQWRDLLPLESSFHKTPQFG